MKKIKLVLILAFLLGCNGSWIEHPDDLVELIRFSGDIIDVQEKQIFSKEEWIKYIDTIPLPTVRYGNCFFDNYGLIVAMCYDTSSLFPVRLAVHINPLQNNEIVLNTSKYKSGMPILLRPHGWVTNVEDRGMASRFYFSKQPVILVKGDPDYWADSSFRYGDRTFTILPVSNGSRNAELRFTYTITRITEENLLQER